MWGPDGFLGANGYYDFAGSGVIHLAGGICALVGNCSVVSYINHKLFNIALFPSLHHRWRASWAVRREGPARGLAIPLNNPRRSRVLHSRVWFLGLQRRLAGDVYRAGKKIGPRLREILRQVEAEVVSNSRN